MMIPMMISMLTLMLIMMVFPSRNLPLILTLTVHRSNRAATYVVCPPRHTPLHYTDGARQKDETSHHAMRTILATADQVNVVEQGRIGRQNLLEKDP